MPTNSEASYVESYQGKQVELTQEELDKVSYIFFAFYRQVIYALYYKFNKDFRPTFSYQFVRNIFSNEKRESTSRQ